MEQEINNTMEKEINKVIQVCEIIRGLIYYNKNVISYEINYVLIFEVLKGEKNI